MISKNEYFKWSVNNDLHLKLTWILSIFTYVTDSNEYIKVEGGKFFVKTDDWHELNNYDVSKKTAPYMFTDNVTVDASYRVNTKQSINSTYGIVLSNLILINKPFGNKIPFINKGMSIKSLEKDYILPILVSDSKVTEDTISVSSYIEFSVSVSYIRSWGSFTTVSATPKLILPPPGLDKFKKDLLKEFTDKYGKDPLLDPVRAVEFEKRLMSFDKDWMKDDPTYGILGSGKVMNARKKQYLMIGFEKGFDSGEAVNITSSLNDEYPKDKEALSTLINQSRAGSFDRGHETQDSGVVSSVLSSATLNITIESDDCKAGYGMDITITDSNYKEVVGRYYISGGKTINIATRDIAKKLIGKVIEMRDPLYCKAPGDTFCKTCCGDVASRYKGAISILAMDIGGKFLNGKMKKMHASVNALREFTIDDMIDI